MAYLRLSRLGAGAAAERAAPFLALGQGLLTLSGKEIAFPLWKVLGSEHLFYVISFGGGALPEAVCSECWTCGLKQL